VRLHFPAAWLLGAIAALDPAAALAHGGGGAMPAEVPPAPPGEGATAQALLREIEAKAAADPETARVVAEPVQNAKRALERAHGALTSGDEAHARMLHVLALEWAEAARDFDRAAAAERAAAGASKRAYEVQTKAERARALLEETQARRGRTAAELARVRAESREAAQSAADAETQRIEATKKKGKGAGDTRSTMEATPAPQTPPATPRPQASPAPSPKPAPPKPARPKGAQ
jgi:hypothetical protein